MPAVCERLLSLSHLIRERERERESAQACGMSVCAALFFLVLCGANVLILFSCSPAGKQATLPAARPYV